MSNRLVENRKAIADRAFGGIGNDMQCFVFGCDAFLGTNTGKVTLQQLCWNTAQIEPLRPAEHGHRQLFNLSGRKQKLHMRWRFFQRFEQSIEGIAGQHVDFIDDVDFVARRDRRITHSLNDLAHIINAGMGGRIHFDHIDMAPLGNRSARLAHAAWVDGWPALAVRPDAI